MHTAPCRPPCRSAAGGPARAAARASPRLAAAAADAAPAVAARRPDFSHGVTFTMHEGNSWHVKFQASGARALVDPWLVGPLTFFDQAWLYTARKKVLAEGAPSSSSPSPSSPSPSTTNRIDVQAVADDTDVVLLSQYLDDHTHMPTLEALPKSLRVVAQPEAAARIAALGFKEVTALRPGESVVVAGGKLRVTALAGSLVGPPWSQRQNAYLLQELVPASGSGSSSSTSGASVFYEPHADAPAETLTRAAPVDVLVGPSVDVTMGGYPLLKGKRDLAAQLKALQARVFVPLANSELDHVGPLAEAMQVDGPRTAEATAAALRLQGLAGVHVEAPVPGEALSIPL
jgi:hypothetical protein